MFQIFSIRTRERRGAIRLPGEERPADSQRGAPVLQTNYICARFLSQSLYMVRVVLLNISLWWRILDPVSGSTHIDCRLYAWIFWSLSKNLKTRSLGKSTQKLILFEASTCVGKSFIFYYFLYFILYVIKYIEGELNGCTNCVGKCNILYEKTIFCQPLCLHEY